MKKITTLSGTVYLYDDVNGKIQSSDDSTWSGLLYLDPVPLRVGSKLKMVLFNGDWHTSTLMTKIEDTEDE